MKALACARCADIRALDPDGGLVSCRCGVVQARWIDPRRGTAEFREAQPGAAYVLGLNNNYLVPALRGEAAMWEDARSLHERATDAPHHIFDESRAACWAVLVRPGVSNDVTWMDPAA